MCFTELLSVLGQDRARITDRDGDRVRVGSSQQKKKEGKWGERTSEWWDPGAWYNAESSSLWKPGSKPGEQRPTLLDFTLNLQKTLKAYK